MQGVITPGLISSCKNQLVIEKHLNLAKLLYITSCKVSLPRSGYELIYSSNQVEALFWKFLKNIT